MEISLGGVLTGDLQRQRAAGTFELLVEDRLDACYRLAAVLLGDRAEAEEATHEAMLRAQRAWPRLRDPDAAAAWLDRIVVNECRDRLRRRRVASGLFAPERLDTAPAMSTDPEFSTADELDALRRAIATLSTEQRIVVTLRYFLDLPLEAVAQRAGIPVGTVKSRLHAATDYLRAAYQADARAEHDR
jgi:RNA polymerase sigma-70 factor (ECF subfamily)